MKIIKIDEFSKLVSNADADNDELESYMKDFYMYFDKIDGSFTGTGLSFITNKNTVILKNLKRVINSNSNYLKNLRKVSKSYQEQNNQIVRDIKKASAGIREGIK